MDERTETTLTHGRLIAAKKVTGTAAYDGTGDRIGTIDDLMIDKISGRTAYAVLSFGGFLGIGDRHHPLPWNTLKYDPEKEGYVVNVSRAQLESGPTYGDSDTVTWDDERWGQRISDYYSPQI